MLKNAFPLSTHSGFVAFDGGGAVAEDAYRKGRATVLAHFAARPVIYPDASFAAKFERPARANIARELTTLQP